MKFSVIIATYNRAEELAKTLESLKKIETTDPWEVVIVDNNSPDNTREVILQAVEKFPVPLRYVMEKEQGRSAALNAGIRVAAGEILAVIRGTGAFMNPQSVRFENAGDDEKGIARTINLDAAVGILSGWSIAPTIGGFASLDLIGSVGHLMMPDEFSEAGKSWAVGARVGILRESFTAPGVSVTGIAVYRIAVPELAFRVLNFTYGEAASEKLAATLREMFVGAARRLVANLSLQECLTKRKETIATYLMEEIAPARSRMSDRVAR
jgi:hypothetical protein